MFNSLKHDQPCALCGLVRPLTFHHLIPRTCHRNKWFKKRFSQEEMKTRGINVCRPCHRFIHKTFSEKQLGRDYNSLDTLLGAESIAKYVQWASKRK